MQKRLQIFSFLMAVLVCLVCLQKDTLTIQPIQADLPEESEDAAVKVQFLGISEGESTLIRFSEGYTLLIDAGSARSGEEVVDYLQQNQVIKIDTLILTGEMDAHVGGANEVLKHVPVGRVLVPALIKDTILDEVTAPIRSIIPVEEGQYVDFPQHAKIHIMHPSEPLSLSPQANSLVFQFIFGDMKFLFTSDINEEAEKRLAERYDIKSQVLKVSDSGSNQASSPIFLDEVDAHAAVIFSDDTDVLGFEDVVERLHETWIDVFQTKSHGTISVLTDGKDYEILREKTRGYFDAKN